MFKNYLRVLCKRKRCIINNKYIIKNIMQINWIKKIILGSIFLAVLATGTQSVSPAAERACVAIRNEGLAGCSRIAWFPAEAVCQGLVWSAYWACMGITTGI